MRVEMTLLSFEIFSILQVKVSQIECDALWRAPEGCTQFFTSESGTIYSYGYPNELQVINLGAIVISSTF